MKVFKIIIAVVFFPVTLPLVLLVIVPRLFALGIEICIDQFFRLDRLERTER